MGQSNYNLDQFRKAQVDRATNYANRTDFMLPRDRQYAFQRHTTPNGSSLPTQHATGEGWERASDPFTVTNAKGESEDHPAYYQGIMLHPSSGKGDNEDASIVGDDLAASRSYRKQAIDYLLPDIDPARSGDFRKTTPERTQLRTSLYNSDVDVKDIEKLQYKDPMYIKIDDDDSIGGYYQGNPSNRHIGVNRKRINNPPPSNSYPEDMNVSRKGWRGTTRVGRIPEGQRGFNTVMNHELGHAIDPFVESDLRNNKKFQEKHNKGIINPIHEGVAEGFTQQRGHPATYQDHMWKDPVNQALYIASLTHTYQQPRRYQGTGVDQSLEPTSPEDMVAKHVKNVQGPLDAKMSQPLPEKKRAQREKGLLQYAQMKSPMHTLGRMWEELPHVRDSLRAHGLHDVAEEAAEHYKMFTRGVDPEQLKLPL